MERTTHAKVTINEAGETEVRELNVVIEAQPGRRHSLLSVDVGQAVERIDREAHAVAKRAVQGAVDRYVRSGAPPSTELIVAIWELLDTIQPESSGVESAEFGGDNYLMGVEVGRRRLAEEIRQILRR